MEENINEPYIWQGVSMQNTKGTQKLNTMKQIARLKDGEWSEKVFLKRQNINRQRSSIPLTTREKKNHQENPPPHAKIVIIKETRHQKVGKDVEKVLVYSWWGY